MIIFNNTYISWNQNKVGWCIIENDNNFERTEDRATVFLKWMDFWFSTLSKHIHYSTWVSKHVLKRNVNKTENWERNSSKSECFVLSIRFDMFSKVTTFMKRLATQILKTFKLFSQRWLLREQTQVSTKRRAF